MTAPQPVISPLFISTWSIHFCSGELRPINTISSPASSNWPSANLAMYIPFFLPFKYPVNRLFVANGSTAGGNFDIGVFSAGGVAIYRKGSTAQSGTSNIQYVTPTTPFVLDIGRYYLGVAYSATTNAFFGVIPGSNYMGRLVGMLQQASALALPATATFATTTNGALPIAGLTKTSSGF